MNKEKLQAFILKKAYKKYVDEVLDITPQELRDRAEDCVMAYGMIMTKDGKVLTLEEMENALTLTNPDKQPNITSDKGTNSPATPDKQ